MKHPTAAPAIAGWRLSSPENKRLQSPGGLALSGYWMYLPISAEPVPLQPVGP